MPNLNLDWQPALLVKVICEPFAGRFCGLQVSRLYLALHPDGVVCAAYDLLAASDFLVQAAVQLLMHGNLTYILEKLQLG